MRILVATTSGDKLREIRSLLGSLPVDVLSLRDFFPVPEPDETGPTFQENARLKAMYYDHSLAKTSEHFAPDCTVAEDSGLEIDALNGEPGVYSARFLRPDATYPERFEEIYRRLASRPDAPRTARFICALCVVRCGTVIYETTGAVEGLVADTPRGTGGFGYDPILYYPPYRRTLGETTEEEKLRVAHRGHAFRAFALWLGASLGAKEEEV
jgi:XTP/dITP diphosphohydrolase